MVSYSINRWSKTLEDITITKYGSSLVDNLIMQKDYPSYVKKDATDIGSEWFSQLDFRFISTTGWEKMTKVYTEMAKELDESLIRNAFSALLNSYGELKEFVDAVIDLKVGS